MEEIIYKNKSLESFHLSKHINEDIDQIVDFTYPIKIKDSRIEEITSMVLKISILEIDNVKFDKVDVEYSIILYCSTIYKELKIKNCSISMPANFFALHCLGIVIIENNVFEEFVDFGDCWFKNDVIIRNNQFKKGTNLLGNLDKPYRVTYDKGSIIENNIGVLDMNVLP